MNEQQTTRNWGIAFLAVWAIGFLPPAIPGAAIGWPASLGLPAGEQLALVLPNIEALRWGYGWYLFYSIAFFPLVVGALRLFPLGVTPTLSYLAVGFAAISTLCRSIGILRWLVPVPVLAGEGTDSATVLVFQAINSYGGAIGEILGVGLFAGAALTALGLGWLRGPGKRWLGTLTLVVGMIHLLSVAEAFGLDLGPYTTVVALSLLLWLLVVGLKMALKKNDENVK